MSELFKEVRVIGYLRKLAQIVQVVPADIDVEKDRIAVAESKCFRKGDQRLEEPLMYIYRIYENIESGNSRIRQVVNRGQLQQATEAALAEQQVPPLRFALEKHVRESRGEPRIPPLRFAPVGMTRRERLVDVQRWSSFLVPLGATGP